MYRCVQAENVWLCNAFYTVSTIVRHTHSVTHARSEEHAHRAKAKVYALLTILTDGLPFDDSWNLNRKLVAVYRCTLELRIRHHPEWMQRYMPNKQLSKGETQTK